MASMKMGAIISILGALIALIPIIYFITLPLESPTRGILTQQIMGLSLMLYFTIMGAVVTAIGLLIFMRAARDELVTEIEREIEKIVQLEEPEAEVTPAQERAAEEKPVIEVQVVNKGQDMVCPHCGELNPLKSTRCVKCKKPLYEAKEGEPRCPVCDAPLRLSQRISEDLFTCGLCFSELRIPIELRREVGLE